MSLSQNSVALAAAALLAAGGCDLRCNGPTTIIPVNIKYGGRALAIATNPQDDKAALVVSESGGIFQTRSSGSQWFQITGTNTFWFSDAHYFDGAPHILIATAFSDMKTANSGGVWRSTSEGSTWAHVPITPPDTTKPFEAYCIAVEHSEPMRIWVGTSQGLISSTDAGATWTFQPPKANFPQIEVRCVIAPSPNHLRVITKQGFRASDDGGGTWIQPTQGEVPTNPVGTYGTHNQLACSPANDEVVYWCGFTGSSAAGVSTIVTRSMDGGSTWETMFTRDAHNRNPFIRTTTRALSSPDKYQLYFSDGQSYTGRAEINKSDEQIGTFRLTPVEHPDNSDIGFKTDGFTPWLLAGDGGLQMSSDQGGNWKMAGNGAGGYLALQISDATGQPHAWDRRSDLYFGTQDNSFWASGDDGNNWPRSTPTEGFHIEIGQDPRPQVHPTGSSRPHPAPIHDRVSFTNSPPVKTWIAAPLFANAVSMNVPSPGQPFVFPIRRLAHETYMAWLPPTDTTNTNEMWVSYNHGNFWLDRGPSPGFAALQDRTKLVSGPGGDILFYADYFKSVNGLEITRAYDLLGNGTPVFSSITNFGTLGTPAVLAQSNLVRDALYAVDPYWPDHILLVDQGAGVIRSTWDGGTTWTVDNNLKTAIMNRGLYRFQVNPSGSTQITTIAFDPHTRGRILVGTVQAGVIYSCNFGQTWRRLEDSENIPNVSSFYFTQEGWVLASSYGRGLWRLSLSCPQPEGPPPNYERRTNEPIFVSGGATFPLGALTADSKFSFVAARGGDIRGFDTGKSGEIENIALRGGTAAGLTMSGKDTATVVPATELTPMVRADSDPKLAQLMKQGFRVKALCLEGKLFKGYVLSKNEIAAADLPKPRVPGPSIFVTLSEDAPRRVAMIKGWRFEPGKALEVLVNDQLVQASATAGRDGSFEFGVPVSPFPGHYVLTVRQSGARALLFASMDYDIMPSD